MSSQLPKAFIEKRLAELQQQERDAAAQVHRIQGAILLCRELLEPHLDLGELREGIERAAADDGAQPGSGVD